MSIRLCQSCQKLPGCCAVWRACGGCISAVSRTPSCPHSGVLHRKLVLSLLHADRRCSSQHLAHYGPGLQRSAGDCEPGRQGGGFRGCLPVGGTLQACNCVPTHSQRSVEACMYGNGQTDSKFLDSTRPCRETTRGSYGRQVLAAHPRDLTKALAEFDRVRKPDMKALRHIDRICGKWWGAGANASDDSHSHHSPSALATAVLRGSRCEAQHRRGPHCDPALPALPLEPACSPP